MNLVGGWKGWVWEHRIQNLGPGVIVGSARALCLAVYPG